MHVGTRVQRIAMGGFLGDLWTSWAPRGGDAGPRCANVVKKPTIWAENRGCAGDPQLENKHTRSLRHPAPPEVHLEQPFLVQIEFPESPGSHRSQAGTIQWPPRIPDGES